MSKHYAEFFEKIIASIVHESEINEGVLGKIEFIIMTFCENYSKVWPLTVLAETIAKNAPHKPGFYGLLAPKLADLITKEENLFDVRAKLADSKSGEGSALFSLLYPAL